MQIGLRHFSPETLSWLAEASSRREFTRYALARRICEQENWRSPNGKLCIAQAYKTLPKIARSLELNLPPAVQARALEPKSRAPAVQEAYPNLELECPLVALGEIRLDLVEDDDRSQWHTMMQTHHPKGGTRRPGANIKYWIVSADHGRLGGIGFCSAQWHQRARDHAIGWSHSARAANLDQLVENYRFLILPGVRVKNLASKVLAIALARLPGDWQKRNSSRPQAVYTYLAPNQAGTCYRAAGWQHCRRQTDKLSKWRQRRPTTSCEVWLKPMSADWRKLLCQEPVFRLGHSQPLLVTNRMDWADVEWARCSHPDGRLRKRLASIGRAWERSPAARISEIFPTRAERIAAIRLLSNDTVSAEHILEGHLEATVERCRTQPLVLALEGTAIIPWSDEPGRTEHPSSAGAQNDKPMTVRAGLAVSESCQLLGHCVFSAQPCDAEMADHIDLSTEIPFASELASACPVTRIVSVCGPTDNPWAMFRNASDHQHELLVQVGVDQAVQAIGTDGRQRPLCELLATELPLRQLDIDLPWGVHPGMMRNRRFEIRSCRVRLPAPTGQADQDLLAVHAKELSSSVHHLDWMLVTNSRSIGIADIRPILHWSGCRELIKAYFCHLKSHTRITQRDFKTFQDQCRCLSFDAIAAWRKMYKLSPEMTCGPDARQR